MDCFLARGALKARKNSYKVNLFNDPEPEIDASVRLELNHSENIFVKDHFQLRLINSNTSHEMMFNFPSNYTLSSGEVASLDNFLRDWRTGEVKRIDTLVLTDFLKICSLCAKESKVLRVNVHSGFRSENNKRISTQTKLSRLHRTPCTLWEKLLISQFQVSVRDG